MRVTDTLSDVAGYSKTYGNFWKTFLRALERGDVTKQKLAGAAAFVNQQIVNKQLETIRAKPSNCLTLAIMYSLEIQKTGKYKAILRYNSVEAAASILDTAVFNLIANTNVTGVERLTLVEEVIGAYELLRTSMRRFKSFESLRAKLNSCDLATKLATVRDKQGKNYDNETRVRDVNVRRHSRSRPKLRKCCSG